MYVPGNRAALVFFAIGIIRLRVIGPTSLSHLSATEDQGIQISAFRKNTTSQLT